MPKSASPSDRLAPEWAFAFALLLVSEPLAHGSPWAAFWTAPCILFASIVITWGAESAQFFLAQGFALAILAWMQTLPEFAVEALLAWKQQTNLLLAGLTGALRLLTGLAWPMIYLTAAVVFRRETGQPLRRIVLAEHQSVEVAGLFTPLLYALFIWWKGTLAVYDACALTAIYAAYLVLLTKLPPEEREGMDELESIPKRIVLAPRMTRTLSILGCFALGGAIIYFTAEPFLGSLVALALAMGIPSFSVIQWLAPVISEFPELLSTFYFARKGGKASIALMNITSSNINQWTLLVAVLPIAFSLGHHSLAIITFTAEQKTELLLTIAQNVLGFMFLLNMKLSWWEALAMFCLFSLQFILPEIAGQHSRQWITITLFVLAAAELVALLVGRKTPPAWKSFSQTWHSHVRT